MEHRRMNGLKMTPTIAPKIAPEAEADAARYICRRVLDALLREDVRGCVSAATIFAHPPAMFSGRFGATVAALSWLKVTHFDGGCLWIPVVASGFMQRWRSAGLAPLWQQGEVEEGCELGDELLELSSVQQIIACFARGLPPGGGALFDAFADECKIAAAQRATCEQERVRWFAALRAASDAATGGALPWHASLLHYDRLGSFLDHPLYPTARAKLGFDAAALKAYSPEFQSSFQLRWLAVPRALHHASVADERGWPALWPGFADVGLPADMAASHALAPVHPFVWGDQLDALLQGCGLLAQAIPAPRPWLTVAPTLSVRTVVLLDAPEWHLKLPLTIRTLGAKNIRTIKPSTIKDGHSIQTLLADIAAREPSIGACLLLTDEERGAHVDNHVFLGYLLRRYPAAALQGSTLVPVASLLAQTPGGTLVAEKLAAQHYGGDLAAFLDDYVDLTLRLHLLLWLRYGIALESNQQNSVIVVSASPPRLRLLLKDNDSARIHVDYLRRRWPDLAAHLADLQDQRIAVADPLPLAQMFTTITLQLNIAVLVERFAPLLDQPAAALYAHVRQRIETVLTELAAQGEDAGLARRVLLDADRLHVKYLLIAATLSDKADTGASDVNKFYGCSAPNFLRPA
jgi:hypothetical protein